MKSIKILKTEQQNPFYDGNEGFNDGSYNQPLYTFEYDGKIGIFSDESCGDFGGHFTVVYDGKTAEWGSFYEEQAFNLFYSQFDEFEYKNFITEIKQAFGVTMPTLQEDEAQERQY